MRLALTFLLFLSFACVAVGDDWPQWRGVNRDGISKETGLLQAWPKDGPTVRWLVKDLGTGYSSPSIAGGRVYIQTTRDKDECTVALDEKTGKKIWETKIGQVGANKGMQYPGTRSTPTVDGKLIYSLASDGELTCLDLEGSVKWQKNLVKDFKGVVGSWAYSESVLIDGDKVVCTPGGSEATLLALNKTTGEVIWKAPVPGGDIADYASIVVAKSGDRKVYVQYLRKSLVGIDAKTGTFLWKDTSTQDQGASILTPVVQGDKVFAAGSRSGGALFELKPDGDGVKANKLYFEKNVAPSIGGAVLVGDNLYGSAGTTIFCADFASGKIKWTERSVGASSVCFADGRLYFRGHSTGEVVLLEPSPDAYKEVGRLKPPERSKIQAWAHPVVANGGLYLSDQNSLVCYEVAAKK